MESFFLACFIFGAVFTLVSALLGIGEHGLGVSHGNVHGGWHVGHHAPHGHPHGHTASGGPRDQSILILNLSTIIGFLTWFGAVGYLLTHAAGWLFLPALVPAVGAGIGVAMLISRFIAKIRAGDRVQDPADYRLEGTVGRVSISIPENGVGEIIFTMADRRWSEAARGEQGQAISRETEVAIISYDAGVATVVPWQKLVADRAVGQPD